MKKKIKILAVTAVIILAALFLKNEYGSVFSGKTYGMQAAIKQKKIDHLFIGSSMFRLGLDIEVLEEELDGNSYILSYNGNQPVFMAKELEYLLDHGVEIENLYVDFFVYSASIDPWISDTKIFLDTDLNFKMDILKLLRQYGDLGLRSMYEMFVTANNEVISMHLINDPVVSSTFHNGGWFKQIDGETEEYLDGLELELREGIPDIQKEGFQKIIKLAEENDIQLVFLETPKYEKLLEDTRKGAYPYIFDQMLEMAESYKMECILAEELDFDHSDGACYQDLIHLSSKGKKIYTEMLCGYLKNER